VTEKKEKRRKEDGEGGTSHTLTRLIDAPVAKKKGTNAFHLPFMPQKRMGRVTLSHSLEEEEHFWAKPMA